MDNSDHLISAIRQLYSLIFYWHKENGKATIEKIIQSNQTWDRNDDNLTEYKAALEEMPPPTYVILEKMYEVARKVRSGILEWNYGERVTGDMNLGAVAKKIIALHDEIKKQEELEQLKDTVLAVISYNIQNDEEYFEKAKDIYNDFFLDNEKNIGGQVALIDTNWEVQKNSGITDKVLFRKPSGLNLKQIEEDDNIFQLVIDGKITITHINIK